MPYNSYFPASYQPIYYGNQNPYYPQVPNQSMMQQQQQTQQTQQQQQPAIQQSGLVVVQSEQEARAYPVAPGNSITFKDERQPYCYVKTMGFNQLDQPTFERYRLVKEDAPQETTELPVSGSDSDLSKDIPYALKSDLDALWDELNALKRKVNAKPKAKKNIEAEAENNDDE